MQFRSILQSFKALQMDYKWLYRLLWKPHKSLRNGLRYTHPLLYGRQQHTKSRWIGLHERCPQKMGTWAPLLTVLHVAEGITGGFGNQQHQKHLKHIPEGTWNIPLRNINRVPAAKGQVTCNCTRNSMPALRCLRYQAHPLGVITISSPICLS